MGRAPEGEVWDLSCQGLSRRHEWEAGNRPVSGCTRSPGSKGEAGRLDPGNLCGPSSILPPPRRDGEARDPASNSLPAAQAAHLERTTFIVDRGNCRLDLGE